MSTMKAELQQLQGLLFTCWVVIILVVAIFTPIIDTAIILTPPQSVTVIERDTAVFTCTVRAKNIELFVNGDNSEDSSVANKGFMTSLINDINKNTIQQNLTALAVASNNNTNITCRALTIDGTDVSVNMSDPAVLVIQGPLSSVVDLSCSFIDSSTVTISWSPPFTLPGTDITGYNISATSNGTTTNYFTSNSYYHLSLTDITDSPLDIELISVNLSGFNGLEGESTSISFEPTVHEIPVSLNSFVHIGELYSIKLELTVSSIVCYGQYPTNINLTIQYSNNGSLVTTIDNIPVPAVDGNTDVLVSDEIVVDLPMDANLTAIVTLDNFESIRSAFTFRTHVTLTATVTDSIGPSIEFVCHFYPDSDATGCYIELLLTNSTSIHTGKGDRTGSNAIVAIPGIGTEGIYQVLVYEIKEDGSTLLVSRMSISVQPPDIQPSSYSYFAATTSINNVPQPSLNFTNNTSSSSPSPTMIPNERNDNTTIIIIIIVVVTMITLAVLVCVICALIWRLCKRFKMKLKGYTVTAVRNEPEKSASSSIDNSNNFQNLQLHDSSLKVPVDNQDTTTTPTANEARPLLLSQVSDDPNFVIGSSQKEDNGVHSVPIKERVAKPKIHADLDSTRHKPVPIPCYNEGNVVYSDNNP